MIRDLFLAVVTVTLLIIYTTSQPCFASYLTSPVHDKDLIEMINNHPRSTWKATSYPKFENMTLGDVRKLLGTIMIKKETDKIPKFKYGLTDFRAPESFDARQKWPHCIHPIRDQQECGSCWAFSASEALSDRYCIASGGKIDVVLSPEYMLQCDQNDYGCDGGMLNTAWAFLATTGIPTDECDPYSSGKGDVDNCPTKCKDGSSISLFKAKKPKNIEGISNIQLELSTKGSLQVAFNVYRDFMSYKSGVYRHISGGFLGGHAVKLVGWGVDTKSNLPYWIIANSWSSSWGMNGFFWMLRGSNECGIEDNVWVGDADI